MSDTRLSIRVLSQGISVVEDWPLAVVLCVCFSPLGSTNQQYTFQSLIVFGSVPWRMTLPGERLRVYWIV